MPPLTEEDTRAALTAADKAAADSDAAVDAASSGAGHAAQAGQTHDEGDESNQLPPGPTLASDDLVERFVRLAESLRTPADSEPAHVAKVMDLGLAPDTVGHRIGITGALAGSGSYSVAVWKLYRDEAPGHHVDVMLFPAGWTGDPREPKHKLSQCTSDFAPFRKKMLSLGFKVSEPELYRAGQWSFFKQAGETAFYVQAQVYPVDKGSGQRHGCLMELSVDAAEMKDVRGG